MQKHSDHAFDLAESADDLIYPLPNVLVRRGPALWPTSRMVDVFTSQQFHAS